MLRRDAGSADLRAMQHAVQRTWTPHSRWHVGGLAWARISVPGLEPRWRTAVWDDGDGQVRAWGWIELPAHLDLYVDPAHPELAGDVLVWFDQLTAGEPTRTVTVLNAEHHLLHALHDAGYRPDRTAQFFQHCMITLDTLPTPRLPDGYRLRPIRPGEAAARATLHRASWHPTRIARPYHSTSTRPSRR